MPTSEAKTAFEVKTMLRGGRNLVSFIFHDGLRPKGFDQGLLQMAQLILTQVCLFGPFVFFFFLLFSHCGEVRENQTCTTSWLPFYFAFAPPFARGNCLLSSTRGPPFLWELLLFLQDPMRESTLFPYQEKWARCDATWWPSNRCMLDSR